MSASKTSPLNMCSNTVGQVGAPPVSRREFITYFATAGVAISAVPTVTFGSNKTPSAAQTTGSSGSSVTSRAPVVSFHLDQPFLDLSGQCAPYVPPNGLRSGQPIAELDQIDLFRCTYGI